MFLQRRIFFYICGMRCISFVYILFLFQTPFLSSTQQTTNNLPDVQDGTTTTNPSTGYPDLDLFYSQLEKNTFSVAIARSLYLLETTPADSIIMDFLRRGYTTFRDTVSLYNYFHYSNTSATHKDRCEMTDKMYTFARKYKSKRLELLADMYKGELMPWSNEEEWVAKEDYYEGIIRKARRVGDAEIEAIILDSRRFHNLFSSRYARSVFYAQRLEEVLEKIDDDYPRKSGFNMSIGMSYYMFKDYDQALPFLYKVGTVEGWNYLASYYKMNNNLDSATYYHRKILLDGGDSGSVNLAIAISNLGRIELEKGNVDAAIAMLEAGLSHMEKHYPADRDFIAGQHISLGEAYLKKGNMATTWDHITAVRNLPDHIEFNIYRRLRELYALESSYYARQGRHDLAKVYCDSALMASAKYEQNSGKHLILLGEQQLKEIEIELKSRQVAQQRNIIVFIFVILALVSGGVILLIRLYLKKNAAYKVLARKAGEWAMPNETAIPVVASGEVIFQNAGSNGKNERESTTGEDRQIMSLIEQEMTQNYLYREVGLSAESLARHLGIHRNILSRAINRVTGGNYNQYINAYRVREAVRIISQNGHKDLYIDELCERVGFSNRSSFYRVFKQFTGLSPAEFQKNATAVTEDQ